MCLSRALQPEACSRSRSRLSFFLSVVAATRTQTLMLIGQGYGLGALTVAKFRSSQEFGITGY